MRTSGTSPKDKGFIYDQATPPSPPSTLQSFYEWAFIHHRPTPTDFWEELRNSAGPKTKLKDRELINAMDVPDFPKSGDTQKKALTIFKFTLNKVNCEGSKQEERCVLAKYMLTYYVTSFEGFKPK